MVSNFQPVAMALKVQASDGRQVLSILSELAGRSLGLNASDVFEALVQREACSSTGVGRGVAIPHARFPQLRAVRSIMVTTVRPVAFNAIDEQPVDLFFALLAPEEAVTEHLRALAKVSRLMRDPGLREQLRQARHDDAVRVLLSDPAQANAA